MQSQCYVSLGPGPIATLLIARAAAFNELYTGERGLPGSAARPHAVLCGGTSLCLSCRRRLNEAQAAAVLEASMGTLTMALGTSGSTCS